MEYVDGPNLSELRLEKADRVLKWGFLEPLVKQLCEALEYAHRENIIHRDLKPANMMLDGRGRLKLADFGIAAMVSDSVSRVSMGNHGLSGTASYMSPQQLDGQLPHVTDDIYSLGSTLYELLTSRAPFFTGDIAHQVRTLAPQPIEKRLAQLRIHNQVPPTVDATIIACLAKEPEKRPQTARAVAELLGLKTATPPSRTPSAVPGPRAEPVLPQVSSSGPAQPVPVPSPSSEAMPAQQPAAPRRAKRARKRAAPLLGLAAAVVIMAIAGGAWWWWNSRGAAGKTTQPTTAPAPEFVSLFNGTDFSGWDGDPQVWTVKDGTITATAGTSKERRPLALFWRGGTVEDFELQLSFRIQSGNSGIYYRAKQLLAYEVGGYQFEISGPQTGGLIETGPDRMRREPSRRGSVTSARVINGKENVTVVGPTVSSALEVRNAFHQSGWNDVVIIVQGNRIIHKLNGHTIVDATDHYEKRPTAGTVALEVYGAVPTTVQFRDIRLKRLAPAGSAK